MARKGNFAIDHVPLLLSGREIVHQRHVRDRQHLREVIVSRPACAPGICHWGTLNDFGNYEAQSALCYVEHQMIKSDAIDERILEALARTARISNREVARALDLADVTVGKRLSRMQRQGIARPVAIVDPRALGLNCAAFVRVVAEPGQARRIAEELAALKEASFVALTGGMHSIVILLLIEDRAALTQFVNDHVRSRKGVRSIDVREIISALKHRLDVVRIQPNMFSSDLASAQTDA